MKPNCYLHALSSHVPAEVLTNDDLSKLVETNDEWITTRTGIKRRHRLSGEENASDLGTHAARKALENAGLDAARLTHILTATCTPDHLSPSLSCIIGGNIGAGPAMSFDFGSACSGFLYGLHLADALLCQDPASQILFVSTEALTRRVNWSDRSTCVLFGDGAGACILNSDPENALARVQDSICKSDGSLHDLIIVGGGTSCRYKPGDPVGDDFFITMQGREVYKHAVRQMSGVCQELLARNGLTAADVDLFVPHQANMRIIEAVGSRLKIDLDHVFTNVAEYGNTSSASVPLALVEALAQGRIKAGDRVLVTAFGSGLTWGAALLQF